MTKQGRRKNFRSGFADCPVCGLMKRLVEHHINGREVPRWNEPWNVVAICSDCHDKVHNNPTVRIKGWVQTTIGRMLDWETI